MKITLVDRDAIPKSFSVGDRSHAVTLFTQDSDAIGALLAAEDGSYLDSFIRHNGNPHKSRYISASAINSALDERRKSREGTPGTKLGWDIPGHCLEVSESISKKFGFAMVVGNYMANDLKTQICVHAWNILPDLSVLDMTSDQFMDGANYRIVPRWHPDWLRYQPNYEEWEDICETGESLYSKEYLEYIQRQGKRINRTPPMTGLSYLHLPAADHDVQMEVSKIVTEFLREELKLHQLSLSRHTELEPGFPTP